MKSIIIIGAGINHWYHANLMYRSGIHALMFCGCVGVNGGGLAHYVGQEKLAPMESWSSIALAKDWFPPSRLQNTPSWHYINSDQWRYEKAFTDYHTVPPNQPCVITGSARNQSAGPALSLTWRRRRRFEPRRSGQRRR